MKIQIVLSGILKNKIIEKQIPESSLVSTISFINQNGLYESDVWYPPVRIKEIKYEYPVAPPRSRVFIEENKE